MNIQKKRDLATSAMIAMMSNHHPAVSNETWEGIAIDACEAVDALEKEMDKRWPDKVTVTVQSGMNNEPVEKAQA